MKVKEIELRMRLEEIEQDRKREEEKKRRSSSVTSSPPPLKSASDSLSMNRGSSTPVIIPSRPIPQTTSTPANSVVSPPTIGTGAFDPDEIDLLDIEEKMLQEAIRLSLETHSNTPTKK
jgi:hypothetical protein